MPRGDADGLRHSTSNFGTLICVGFLASQMIPNAELFWGPVLIGGVVIFVIFMLRTFVFDGVGKECRRQLTKQELEMVAEVQQKVRDGTWNTELRRAMAEYRLRQQPIMMDVIQDLQPHEQDED